MLVFRDAPVVGSIPFELPSLQMPVLTVELLVRLLEPAFIIALLSSVSTLLMALQIDAITGTHHQPNRELVSHGAGNIAAGAIGGLPGGMTGATLANVANGGRSQAAGVIAGLLLLLMIVGVRQVARESHTPPSPAFSSLSAGTSWTAGSSPGFIGSPAPTPS